MEQIFRNDIFDSEYQNLQKIPIHFCASSYGFRDTVKIKIVYLQKQGPRSHSTILARTPFDGKCQNLQRTPHIFAQALTISEILPFYICYLQKVGQVMQYNFATIPFEGKCQKSTRDSHTFLH